MLDLDPLRCTEAEAELAIVSFTGTGAANPTKRLGRGVAITWVSTGLYQLVFGDKQGLFEGMNFGFDATVPGGVAGYTAVAGAFDATGTILQVSVYNSAFALANLAALQNVLLMIFFKRADPTT